MTSTVKLTAEQKKLVRGVPGLAERAARDAMKRFGPILPMEEMIRSAHYGIAVAAQSFDTTRGIAFEQWAYLKAQWTIVDDARTERRQSAQIAAGRCAVIELLRFEHRAPRDEDAHATDPERRAELQGYKGAVVAAFLRGVAALPLAAGGEDEMIARVDAARAATALSRAYEGLRPEQIELLACESEADLQALAPRWGKSWWTLQRARAKLIKVIGARLAGQEIDAMPAWDDEIWRALQRETGGPMAAPEPVTT